MDLAWCPETGTLITLVVQVVWPPETGTFIMLVVRVRAIKPWRTKHEEEAFHGGADNRDIEGAINAYFGQIGHRIRFKSATCRSVATQEC